LFGNRFDDAMAVI